MNAKNGGKVPKDYVGAYEKSLKARVACVNVDSPSGELEETVRIWPIIPMPQPIPTSNAFAGLDDSEDDDDESEVVKALSQLTSNVNLLSHKQSQKSRRKAKGAKLDVAHLNVIARDVKSGKISLPDLSLDSNEEFTYVWALVDSGAGANVAHRKHFAQCRRVNAPEISLTAANGSALPNRGAFEVVTMGKDGVPMIRQLYDADVDMPILSVAEISQEGQEGSDVRFRRKDG